MEEGQDRNRDGDGGDTYAGKQREGEERGRDRELWRQASNIVKMEV